jgi:hypothetical protein
MHCPECVEYDARLCRLDRADLRLADVGGVGDDPFLFCGDEGISYFMPALVRLALAPSPPGCDWFGNRLLWYLYSGGPYNSFLAHCSVAQRQTVTRVLGHLVETRVGRPECNVDEDDLLRAYEVWSQR